MTDGVTGRASVVTRVLVAFVMVAVPIADSCPPIAANR